MTPFTVVIPVYNEEALLFPNTERLIAYLDPLGLEYEILIGSNGSTDLTPQLGEGLRQRFPQVNFLHMPERGVGRVFKTLVAQARYPAIVSIDMDLSTDFDFIPRALAMLQVGHVIVGVKKKGIQQRSWLRKLGSDIFVRAVRLLLDIEYDDYSITAKAYRTESVRRFLDVIDEGSSYVLSICYLIQRAGGEIIQVPVSCVDWRPSRFNLANEAIYKFRHLFRFWLKFRVDRLIRWLNVDSGQFS
ncbi:MAG: glycosyltransferase family 2 protein [Gammaproteobacteria bacterium]|nr:glycosyltransferase family 2 protein [Gammaproteobacteria bacterium]MCP5195484.1 glycosyltransferase family 2 protein [Gammaproteobacteria bacterium]